MAQLEEFVQTLNGKPILVFGLGVSGLSLVEILIKSGAKIIVGDDNKASLSKASDLGAETLDDYERDFSEFAFLLLSPGVPLTHPEPHKVVDCANKAGIEIFGDIELFFRIFPDCKTIGITGTNGKSTTTSLINHVLNSCGDKAQVGGNIGSPVFNMDLNSLDGWIVLEMSSFQIDLCPTFRPDIAIITNLTPDHIDRHGDMSNYTDVKARIFEPKIGGDYNAAVIATDDEYTRKIFDKVKGQGSRRLIEVSTIKRGEDMVYSQDNVLYDVAEGEGRSVGDFTKIFSLRGVHNHQNSACCYAAAKIVGHSLENIWAGIESFSGLQHRQYLARTINGVTYVNDSKATNAAATAMALGCSNNVYWIVGGRRKKTGLDGLEDFFSTIKHAFLIGESTEDFADWFDKYGIEYSRCYTLDIAVSQAHKMAQDNRGQPGGAGSVLLSPACASFDQFPSFEDRGSAFCKLIDGLGDGA